MKRQSLFTMFVVLALVFSFANVSPAYAAGIVVNTTDDELNSDGDCSLREAITAANTNAATDGCPAGIPGADTITFSVIGTITLTSGLPSIADTLTIDGPGAANLTISGNNAVQAFTVNTGKTFTLRKVTIANSKYSSISNQGGALTVAEAVIANNRGYDGAGIQNARGGTVTLIDSTLTGNIANGGWGGGIFNYGVFTVTRSSLIGNRSQDSSYSYGGGGITNWYGATLYVIDSTLAGNVADCYGCSGGGIYNTGSVTIRNSTLSGNSAKGGGGIFNSSGSVTIINSTLYDNRGQYWGNNLLGNGYFLLYNSVIATSFAGLNCYNTYTVDGGHNLQYPSSYCGSTIPVADPRLGPLQDNGGSTFTHALLAGSPAIDAIPQAACGFTTSDQRGVTRPQGSTCDIGAFELVQNQPPAVDAGLNATNIQGETFSGSGVFTDPDSSVWTATVDYGDGSGSQPLALNQDKTFSLNHTYAAAGTYLVTVTVGDDQGSLGSDTLTVTVLTPRQGTEDLMGQVQALIPGTLNEGQGNALIVKLDGVIKQLEKGNTNTALNELEAFINAVNADISAGKLALEEGQPLLDAANAIIASLGG